MSSEAARPLGFWAAWILIMEWVDIYWLAMPQLRADGPHLDFIDLAAVSWASAA